MNKSLKYILTVSACTLLFFSCKKETLEVDPVNEFLSNNYYKTENQIGSALIGAYDPIGWSMAFGQWISPTMYGEIRSDNANAGGDATNNDQPGWQEFDDFTQTNTNTVIHPMYRRNYIGISRVNSLLKNCKAESPAVDVYKAEALFLRAYYHFELFKHFGPVPVITEELTPKDVDLSRNTMSELMQQVIDDCTAAAAVLPISAKAGEEGRATKGAALALMGKAYLYWADLKNDDALLFGKAAEVFQQLVDLGIYELADDMSTLFRFNVRNTKESVFEIQHNPLWSSDWSWFEGIDGNGM
ncbi:MAG: RagB/SusD family nutrient uptake outer membrane protein, partial [Bacteroidia bacterium]|nr:RagB/SusD family nutrient uptake outer membrane protein [Bacteroidia bacterium]